MVEMQSSGRHFYKQTKVRWCTLFLAVKTVFPCCAGAAYGSDRPSTTSMYRYGTANRCWAPVGGHFNSRK